MASPETSRSSYSREGHGSSGCRRLKRWLRSLGIRTNEASYDYRELAGCSFVFRKPACSSSGMTSAFQ